MTPAITPTHKLRPVWLTIGWLLVGLVVYLSLKPGWFPLDALAHDGVAHGLAYATLMLWFLQLYPISHRPWLALGLLALGVALEGLQGFTADREPSVNDAIVNTIGIGVGWLLGRTWLSRTLEMIEKKILRVNGNS